MQTSICTLKYIQSQSKVESKKENQPPKLNAVYKFGAKKLIIPRSNNVFWLYLFEQKYDEQFACK